MFIDEIVSLSFYLNEFYLMFVTNNTLFAFDTQTRISDSMNPSPVSAWKQLNLRVVHYDNQIYDI